MEARKVLLLAWRAREFLALLSEDMLAFPPGKKGGAWWPEEEGEAV